jgi:hypothetical protein
MATKNRRSSATIGVEANWCATVIMRGGWGSFVIDRETGRSRGSIASEVRWGDAAIAAEATRSAARRTQTLRCASYWLRERCCGTGNKWHLYIQIRSAARDGSDLSGEGR